MYQPNKKMPFELNCLQLENFKCFKNSNEIAFKKLTIFTGANSSGKSSIIQAIVGALQSNIYPFIFSTNGKYINMGDFYDISRNQNRAGEIFIKFKLSDPKNNTDVSVKTGFKLNITNKLCQLNSFESTTNFFSVKLRRSGRKLIMDFSYDPANDPEAKPSKQKTFETILSIVLSEELNKISE